MKAAAKRSAGETVECVIRRGEPGDVKALRALECAVFDLEQMTARSFARYLRIPSADVLVALVQGEIAGNAIVSYRARSQRARLISIAVATRNTGRGIGTALLRSVEACARDHSRREMWLEVRRDNAAAISLYTRAGYRQAGVKPGYYADFCDALVFARDLAA